MVNAGWWPLSQDRNATPGLVVEGGRGEDVPGQLLGRAEDPPVLAGSPASRAWIAADALGATAANAPSSASECRIAVAGDEVDVVVVVAGEQRRAVAAAATARAISCPASSRLILMPRTRSAFSAMMRDDGVDAVGDVVASRSSRPAAGRTPRPSQCSTTGAPGPGEHLAVDVLVVGGRRRGPGQVAAGHQHRAGARGPRRSAAARRRRRSRPAARSPPRRRGRCSPRPPARRPPTAPRPRCGRSARGSPWRRGPCCAARCPWRRRRRGPTTRRGGGTPAWRPSRCRRALRARSRRRPAARRARRRRRRGSAAARSGRWKAGASDSSQALNPPPASIVVTALIGRATAAVGTDELGQVDPRAGARALQAGLGQPDAAGAGQEVELVRGVLDDVADELLPLGLEPVLERRRCPGRPSSPARSRAPRRRSGFHTGFGRGVAGLDAAVEQPGDGAAVGAVDLELDQLLAVDPDRPAGVELRDHAAVELEHPRRRRRPRSRGRARPPRRRGWGCG